MTRLVLRSLVELTGEVVGWTRSIARSDYFKQFQGISETVIVKLKDLTRVQGIPVKAYCGNSESDVDSEASSQDDLAK